MIIIEVPLLFIIGLITGTLASIVGLGGGFLIVPILILFFPLSAENAVAVSLVAICGTSFSATIGYIRQKRVDYKLSLLYDVLDVPGVVSGAYITTILKDALVGVCGFFIIFISLLLVRNREVTSSPARDKETRVTGKGWKRRMSDSSNQVFEYTIRRPSLALISSFMGGLVTGLAGLGGGITDATTMILLGVPPHIAVASSEFAMALTNGTGVIAHGILQNILLEYAFPLTVGTIIGAQIGCSLAKYIKVEALRRMLCAIAFLLGLRLILLLFNI